MANATPPHSRSPAPGRGAPSARIEKSAVEARQGRRGGRVLTILAVSVALLVLAYALLFFLVPGNAHAEWLERPICAAARPVVPPRTPPARMSLNQW